MAEKVKRYLLENDPVETFEFIGICTAQSDFRLAWQLNTRFNIFLEKSNELIEVPIKKTKEFDRYNFYSYHDRQNLISYFLIRNKQEGHILLSEKPSIDYFLIMQENYILEPQDMIDELRKMDSIIAAFAFSSDEFHLSEYLIFEK
jgi:hypothetical protein